jgi:succinyl-CoA synthetase alpha subunit
MAIWVDNERACSCRASPARRARSTPSAAATTARKVVAGVTPGKGGETVEGIPGVRLGGRGARGTGANASMIFVPPPFAADAIMEAPTPASS